MRLFEWKGEFQNNGNQTFAEIQNEGKMCSTRPLKIEKIAIILMGKIIFDSFSKGFSIIRKKRKSMCRNKYHKLCENLHSKNGLFQDLSHFIDTTKREETHTNYTSTSKTCAMDIPSKFIVQSIKMDSH